MHETGVRLDTALTPVPDFGNAEVPVHLELVEPAGGPDDLDREMRALDVLATEHVAFVRLGAPDQLEILTEKNVQGSPALVVEVVSDGTRRHDEQTKRRLYARCGVREYWMVDVHRNLVTLHRRMGTRMFCRVATLGTGRAAVLTTPLLPGLEAPLDDLLASDCHR